MGAASSWTRTADLRAQVQRRWDNGELLAERVQPAGLFPLRLQLRVPSSAALSAQFDAVRGWVAELQQLAASGAGVRLVMREVQHRVIGHNSLPAEAWIDSADDALLWLGKRRDGQQFDALVERTRECQLLLLPWLQRQPLRALKLAAAWPQLLAIVAWLQAHPRPGVYLRQVDVPGVHSKFIEMHRAVLAELFERVLPASAVDPAALGSAGFARRYGFREKPLRVRMRWLDPQLDRWMGGVAVAGPDVPGGLVDGDYTLSQHAFSCVDPAVRRVVITENEINFLAFPPLAQALVIFGAGYGFDALAEAAWLRRCELHYWGDIDTHGFAILNQLRSHFPQARSLLMERATLLAHRSAWTDEGQPTQRDLPLLDGDERELYDDLRWRRLDDAALRLEQERIGFGWVEQAVAGLR